MTAGRAVVKGRFAVAVGDFHGGASAQQNLLLSPIRFVQSIGNLGALDGPELRRQMQSGGAIRVAPIGRSTIKEQKVYSKE